MNTEKIPGLRRVYDVPSWSRFVPKGNAPKGASTITLPTLTTNPNRVVVELFGWTGFSKSPNLWLAARLLVAANRTTNRM